MLHHVTPELPGGSDDADPHRARRLVRLGRISDPVPAWIDESALRCIETMDENRDSLGLHDLQDIDANAIGQGSLPRTGARVGTVASLLDLPVVGQACFVDWIDRSRGGA